MEVAKGLRTELETCDSKALPHRPDQLRKAGTAGTKAFRLPLSEEGANCKSLGVRKFVQKFVQNRKKPKTRSSRNGLYFNDLVWLLR
jgi:hypothetical protein